MSSASSVISRSGLKDCCAWSELNSAWTRTVASGATIRTKTSRPRTATAPSAVPDGRTEGRSTRTVAAASDIPDVPQVGRVDGEADRLIDHACHRAELDRGQLADLGVDQVFGLVADERHAPDDSAERAGPGAVDQPPLLGPDA